MLRNRFPGQLAGLIQSLRQVHIEFLLNHAPVGPFRTISALSSRILVDQLQNCRVIKCNATLLTQITPSASIHPAG